MSSARLRQAPRGVSDGSGGRGGDGKRRRGQDWNAATPSPVIPAEGPERPAPTTESQLGATVDHPASRLSASSSSKQQRQPPPPPHEILWGTHGGLTSVQVEDVFVASQLDHHLDNRQETARGPVDDIQPHLDFRDTALGGRLNRYSFVNGGSFSSINNISPSTLTSNTASTGVQEPINPTHSSYSNSNNSMVSPNLDIRAGASGTAARGFVRTGGPQVGMGTSTWLFPFPPSAGTRPSQAGVARRAGARTSSLLVDEPSDLTRPRGHIACPANLTAPIVASSTSTQTSSSLSAAGYRELPLGGAQRHSSTAQGSPQRVSSATIPQSIPLFEVGAQQQNSSAARGNVNGSDAWQPVGGPAPVIRTTAWAPLADGCMAPLYPLRPATAAPLSHHRSPLNQHHPVGNAQAGEGVLRSGTEALQTSHVAPGDVLRGAHGGGAAGAARTTGESLRPNVDVGANVAGPSKKPRVIALPDEQRRFIALKELQIATKRYTKTPPDGLLATGDGGKCSGTAEAAPERGDSPAIPEVAAASSTATRSSSSCPSAGQHREVLKSILVHGAHGVEEATGSAAATTAGAELRTGDEGHPQKPSVETDVGAAPPPASGADSSRGPCPREAAGTGGPSPQSSSVGGNLMFPMESPGERYWRNIALSLWALLPHPITANPTDTIWPDEHDEAFPEAELISFMFILQRLNYLRKKQQAAAAAAARRSSVGFILPEAASAGVFGKRWRNDPLHLDFEKQMHVFLAARKERLIQEERRRLLRRDSQMRRRLMLRLATEFLQAFYAPEGATATNSTAPRAATKKPTHSGITAPHVVEPPPSSSSSSNSEEQLRLWQCHLRTRATSRGLLWDVEGGFVPKIDQVRGQLLPLVVDYTRVEAAVTGPRPPRPPAPAAGQQTTRAGRTGRMWVEAVHWPLAEPPGASQDAEAHEGAPAQPLHGEPAASCSSSSSSLLWRHSGAHTALGAVALHWTPSLPPVQPSHATPLPARRQLGVASAMTVQGWPTAAAAAAVSSSAGRHPVAPGGLVPRPSPLPSHTSAESLKPFSGGAALPEEHPLPMEAAVPLGFSAQFGYRGTRSSIPRLPRGTTGGSGSSAQDVDFDELDDESADLMPDLDARRLSLRFESARDCYLLRTTASMQDVENFNSVFNGWNSSTFFTNTTSRHTSSTTPSESPLSSSRWVYQEWGRSDDAVGTQSGADLCSSTRYTLRGSYAHRRVYHYMRPYDDDSATCGSGAGWCCSEANRDDDEAEVTATRPFAGFAYSSTHVGSWTKRSHNQVQGALPCPAADATTHHRTSESRSDARRAEESYGPLSRSEASPHLTDLAPSGAAPLQQTSTGDPAPSPMQPFCGSCSTRGNRNDRCGGGEQQQGALAAPAPHGGEPQPSGAAGEEREAGAPVTAPAKPVSGDVKTSDGLLAEASRRSLADTATLHHSTPDDHPPLGELPQQLPPDLRSSISVAQPRTAAAPPTQRWPSSRSLSTMRSDGHRGHDARQSTSRAAVGAPAEVSGAATATASPPSTGVKVTPDDRTTGDGEQSHKVKVRASGSRRSAALHSTAEIFGGDPLAADAGERMHLQQPSSTAQSQLVSRNEVEVSTATPSEVQLHSSVTGLALARGGRLRRQSLEETVSAWLACHDNCWISGEMGQPPPVPVSSGSAESEWDDGDGAGTPPTAVMSAMGEAEVPLPGRPLAPLRLPSLHPVGGAGADHLTTDLAGGDPKPTQAISPTLRSEVAAVADAADVEAAPAQPPLPEAKAPSIISAVSSTTTNATTVEDSAMTMKTTTTTTIATTTRGAGGDERGTVCALEAVGTHEGAPAPAPGPGPAPTAAVAAAEDDADDLSDGNNSSAFNYGPRRTKGAVPTAGLMPLRLAAAVELVSEVALGDSSMEGLLRPPGDLVSPWPPPPLPFTAAGADAATAPHHGPPSPTARGGAVNSPCGNVFSASPATLRPAPLVGKNTTGLSMVSAVAGLTASREGSALGVAGTGALGETAAAKVVGGRALFAGGRLDTTSPAQISIGSEQVGTPRGRLLMRAEGGVAGGAPGGEEPDLPSRSIPRPVEPTLRRQRMGGPLPKQPLRPREAVGPTPSTATLHLGFRGRHWNALLHQHRSSILEMIRMEVEVACEGGAVGRRPKCPSTLSGTGTVGQCGDDLGHSGESLVSTQETFGTTAEGTARSATSRDPVARHGLPSPTSSPPGGGEAAPPSATPVYVVSILRMVYDFHSLLVDFSITYTASVSRVDLIRRVTHYRYPSLWRFYSEKRAEGRPKLSIASWLFSRRKSGAKRTATPSPEDLPLLPSLTRLNATATSSHSDLLGPPLTKSTTPSKAHPPPQLQPPQPPAQPPPPLLQQQEQPPRLKGRDK